MIRIPNGNLRNLYIGKVPLWILGKYLDNYYYIPFSRMNVLNAAENVDILRVVAPSPYREVYRSAKRQALHIGTKTVPHAI